MDFKVVVSDPESGKSYQAEVKDDQAKRLKGLKIGQEFDGSAVGLSDFTLVVTGGSDTSGFPMRKGVHGAVTSKVLTKGGVGYKTKDSKRIRKRLHGEVVDDNIAQINVKVTKKGKKSIEEVLGKKAEGAEGEVPEGDAPQGAPAEEKSE